VTVCAICGIWWWQPRAACAGQFSVVPSILVSEEFNDNVNEVVSGARSDFITRLQPGASLTWSVPVLQLEASYNLDYRYYARGTMTDGATHNATLKESASFFEHFLALDANESFTRVSLNVARDYSQESLSVNQTDQNLAFVSPYLNWRLGEKGTLKTGYRYTDVRYWSQAGINKQQHSAFAQYAGEPTAKLSLSAGYTFTDTEAEPVGYSQHDISAGFKYQFGATSFLYGTLGNSWQEYTSGRDVSSLFWNAGLTYDFGFAVATLETIVQYADDPLTISTKETDYTLRVNKTMQRAMVAFSGGYSEYVNTLTGALDHRRAFLTCNGNYQFLPKLTGTLGASADRVSRQVSTDFLYHLVGSAALTYSMNKELNLGLTYSRIAYRNALERSSDGMDGNRAIMEIRKLF